MLVTQANDVKVYNLSAGKSLPEWLSERKKRQLLKQDIDLRRRIELIQDFDMPTASNNVKVSPDGQYILTTGVYKPRLKCFDVSQLSIKFDRCFDSEIVQFEMLSEDFSKVVFLQSDRYLEFHAQYGKYYRTRMPKYGRDMSFHKGNCDLYLVGDGPEVFRLNLEQGRFLQPFETDSQSINVCEVNPVHQLLTVGTGAGKIVCFDPRSRESVGSIDIALCGWSAETLGAFDYLSVTALGFKNALQLGIGTNTGHVLLYDIRANKPYFIKDHLYDLPIKRLSFQTSGDNVISADNKVIRIWDETTGKSLTTIEPGYQINDFAVYPSSGLILLANEAEKNGVYYIPSLGKAPRWCSFLDNITEELEESGEVVVYDDYKFVTKEDLENLGLSHLRGSNLMRAYMHGYFIDIRLYHKAKSIVEPFAYEEYRKNKIREQLEEQRASRIRLKKIPKVNRLLAEKLLDEKAKHQGQVTDEGISNPLGDERFGAMFKNPDFQVDMQSEEYRLLYPVVSKQDKQRVRKAELKVSDRDLSADVDDEDVDYASEKPASKQQSRVKMVALSEDSSVTRKIRGKAFDKSDSLGDILAKTVPDDVIKEHGSALGSKEVTFMIGKSKNEESREANVREHVRERKKLRRSAGALVPDKKNAPVYWRGKRMK